MIQFPDVSLTRQSRLPVTHVVVPHPPEARHGHLVDHVVGVPETTSLEYFYSWVISFLLIISGRDLLGKTYE